MKDNPNYEQIKLVELYIKGIEKKERKQEKTLSLYNLAFKQSFINLNSKPYQKLKNELLISCKSHWKGEIIFNNNNYKNTLDIFEKESSFNDIIDKMKKLIITNINNPTKKFYELKIVNTDSFKF